MGVAEDTTPKGPRRTAIIGGEADTLYMVTEGEAVGERYRVTKIGADAVELEDVLTKVYRRLAFAEPVRFAQSTFAMPIGHRPSAVRRNLQSAISNLRWPIAPRAIVASRMAGSLRTSSTAESRPPPSSTLTTPTRRAFSRPSAKLAMLTPWRPKVPTSPMTPG